ncbi:terpene synthase [Chitinophaga varians]|uniref:Terpene synthase n=1 Tax=Chitinophaga varians TaxID=2202339 RepID=A0A847RX60_9BACT|nr:terpene synthase [Chitinophaga varians]NLR67632.1 terpene synthase [Chitinophaga varians]
MNTTNLLAVSQFHYPFPMLKNPYAAVMQEITDNEWIDGTYLSLYKDDPVTRKKYKKTKTAHIASQWFPTASLERLRPACRLMLWTLYNDDKYEEYSPEEISFIEQQSLAVLKGSLSGEDAGIPLGGLLATLREELVQFVPPESMTRFTDGLQKYFNGLKQEQYYKSLKTFPTVEESLAIREDSLCLYPFLELLDLETGLILPEEVHQHPVIKRLKALTVRMMVCFNEVQSFSKDEATDAIYYNVLKVIQHQRNLSFEEAVRQILHIHNEYLNEFQYLQRFLPDFGPWQDAVVNRVHYFSMTLNGWRSISSGLDRYNSLTGFPDAQTAKNALDG